MKLFYILLLFFSQTQSFIHNNLINNIQYKKNAINNLSNDKLSNDKLSNYRLSKINMFNTPDIDDNSIDLFLNFKDNIHCTEKLDLFFSDINKDIIKYFTSLLPRVDVIGKYVLGANEVIIKFLIDDDTIDMKYKKPVILFIIKSVQNSDNLGTSFLTFYYDLVNKLI